MRCLFCKRPSDASRSVEHVIPEALGNHTLVLPAGAVCDGCNNYFSRKVEGPFLNASWTRLLRHEQGIPSKRGRVPTMRAVAPGAGKATMHAPTHTDPRFIAFDSTLESYRWLLSSSRNVMLTEELITPPSRTIVSRFIGKIAVEFLASRLVHVPGGMDYLIDETGLDRIRNHARRGSDPHWPLSVRRIYPTNARWLEDGSYVQRVWEADFFRDTEGSEYVLIVIFGIEFAIHLGEPDISGYIRWLLLNQGQSPLYSGPYEVQLRDRAGSFDRHHLAIVGSATNPQTDS